MSMTAILKAMASEITAAMDCMAKLLIFEKRMSQNMS